MFTMVRDNLRRFAPERLQARGLSRAMRDASGVQEPWRMRTLVDGKETEYRFFFVCGFGKSGTNWVNNLLNLHPHVRCDGEYFLNTFGWALDQFTNAPHQKGHGEPYRTIATDAVHDLVRRVLLCNLRENPHATVLGDRSPRGLSEVLPGAPTIWLVRDGRDVVVSYTYHYLRLRPAYNMRHWSDEIRAFFVPFADRFAGAGRDGRIETARELLAERRWVGFVSQQWAKRIEQDLEAKAGYASPLLEIRYESLHADTEQELGRMLSFLGVDPSEASPVETGDMTRAGFANERPGEFYRKGAVGDWKNYDTPAFREAFTKHAGDAAARAGYGEWNNAA
ncbi:MAG: sulfotransferase domain-containing protein [Planctomycetota bacterium]